MKGPISSTILLVTRISPLCGGVLALSAFSPIYSLIPCDHALGIACCVEAAAPASMHLTSLVQCHH